MGKKASVWIARGKKRGEGGKGRRLFYVLGGTKRFSFNVETAVKGEKFNDTNEKERERNIDLASAREGWEKGRVHGERTPSLKGNDLMPREAGHQKMGRKRKRGLAGCTEGGKE